MLFAYYAHVIKQCGGDKWSYVKKHAQTHVFLRATRHGSYEDVLGCKRNLFLKLLLRFTARMINTLSARKYSASST